MPALEAPHGIVARLARIEGVVAVALGGSRAYCPFVLSLSKDFACTAAAVACHRFNAPRRVRALPAP